MSRELFGNSDEEAPEVDNTENADNGLFKSICISALKLTSG